MNSADEIVAIVDARNRVVGAAPRWDMRQNRLPHRSTYILVFNSRGDLCVQKRTATKDVFPGLLRHRCRGRRSGRRVLRSRAPGASSPRRSAFTACPSPTSSSSTTRTTTPRCGAAFFSCVYDGDLVLQEAEVESAAFMPVADVLSHAEEAPYTPDGLYVLRRYLGIAAAP